MKNNKNHAAVKLLINTLYSESCPILGSKSLYMYSSGFNDFKNNKQLLIMNGFKINGFIMQLNITEQDNLKRICTDTVYEGVMNEINYIHQIEVSPLTAQMFISDILFNDMEFSQKYFVTVKPEILADILNNTLEKCKNGTYYK